MREIHIFIHLGYWHNEVDIKVIDYVDDQTEGNNEARVLEISQLDVHRAELHAPPDRRVLRWRRLEPERIPVGWLQVFEMARQVIVIDLVVHELAFVSGHRVSPKQSCNVLRHPVVETSFVLNQLFVGIIVLNLNWIIMLLCDVSMIRNVRINSTVARFRYVLITVWVTFFGCPAIGWLFDDGPAKIVLW